MKNLLILLAVLSVPAVADSYVSPTEYRDYSCEELREDYHAIGDAMRRNMRDQLDLDHRSLRRHDLRKEYGSMDVRRAAIRKAAERSNCDLNVKAASV